MSLVYAAGRIFNLNIHTSGTKTFQIQCNVQESEVFHSPGDGFMLIHETVKVGFIDFDSENRCVKSAGVHYKSRDFSASLHPDGCGLRAHSQKAYRKGAVGHTWRRWLEAVFSPASAARRRTSFLSDPFDQRTVDTGFTDRLKARTVDFGVVQVGTFTKPGVSGIPSGLKQRPEQEGFTQVAAVFRVG